VRFHGLDGPDQKRELLAIEHRDFVHNDVGEAGVRQAPQALVQALRDVGVSERFRVEVAQEVR